MAYFDYWLNLGDKLLNNIINITNPSWPQLCLIFILLFHKNISSLVDRIKHIGATGIDIDQFTRQPPAELPEEIETNYNQLTQMKTINESIEFINSYLNHKYQAEPESARKLLVSELANTYFNFRCQGVYNLIFGSQIRLLKDLLTNINSGLSKIQVTEYFNKIAKTYPDQFSTWNIDTYLSFLIQAKLVVLDSESYRITDFGVDFLTWLQRSGLQQENKPL